MSNFEDYLTNSSYAKAYGFNGKGIIYIENERDLSFWEKIISEVYPEQYEFKRATTEGSSIRGKRALEKLYDTLNENVLVAIDCDFDYLSPSRNQYSKHVHENPFVLHTFSFSRESVLCNLTNLNYVLSRIKFFIPSDYRFDLVLSKLSEICYSYLLPFCFLMEKKSSTINESDFHNPLRLFKVELESEDWSIAEATIKESTDKLMKQITNQVEYAKFVKHLNVLGLNQVTAYRYISGHVLKEDIIDPIIHRVTNDLKNKEIELIKKQCSNEMINDRIRGVRNHFKLSCSFNTLLENNNIIDDDEIYIKIVNKIKNIPFTV